MFTEVRREHFNVDKHWHVDLFTFCKRLETLGRPAESCTCVVRKSRLYVILYENM